jgi:hypothetical protein
LQFHGNDGHFYVVDSYINATNNKNNQKGTIVAFLWTQWLLERGIMQRVRTLCVLFQLAASQQIRHCLVLI